MPNIKSAKKRMRQAVKRNAKNVAVKSLLKTAAKSVEVNISANKKEEAGKSLNQYYKLIDKAICKGIIKANTGARNKSKMTKKVNTLGQNGK